MGQILDQALAAFCLARQIAGGGVEGSGKAQGFRPGRVEVRRVDPVGHALEHHAPGEEPVAEKAGQRVVVGFPQLPGIVFAHRIHRRIGRGGEKGVEFFVQQVVADQRSGQPGDRLGKGQIAHLLVVADASVVDGHHAACFGKVMAKALGFAEDGRQDGGVAVVAVDDLGPFAQADHQGGRRLLQQDVHGEVVKMARALAVERVQCLVLRGIGVDALFFQIAGRVDQVDGQRPFFCRGFFRFGKDPHIFPARLLGIVQVDFKGEIQRGKAQLLGVHEAVKRQNHADLAARTRQGLGQLAGHILDPAGPGQAVVFAGQHPDVVDFFVRVRLRGHVFSG